MNWKLMFAGITFLAIGSLMVYDIRKRKPASEKTNWKGQLMPQYIQFWICAVMIIVVGIVFIFESLANKP
jgi:hypothetical protein